MPTSVNALVGKEIRLVGTHRFHHEYAVAAPPDAKRVDVRPVITSTLPMERIADAFAIAGIIVANEGTTGV